MYVNSKWEYVTSGTGMTGSFTVKIDRGKCKSRVQPVQKCLQLDHDC